MYTLLTSIKGIISRKQFFLSTLFRGIVGIVIVVLGYALIPANSTGDYIAGMTRFLLYTTFFVGVALTVFVLGMIPSVIKRLRDVGHRTKWTRLWAFSVFFPWLFALSFFSREIFFLGRGLRMFVTFFLPIICFLILVIMEFYLLLKSGKK